MWALFPWSWSTSLPFYCAFPSCLLWAPCSPTKDLQGWSAWFCKRTAVSWACSPRWLCLERWKKAQGISSFCLPVILSSGGGFWFLKVGDIIWRDHVVKYEIRVEEDRLILWKKSCPWGVPPTWGDKQIPRTWSVTWGRQACSCGVDGRWKAMSTAQFCELIFWMLLCLVQKKTVCATEGQPYRASFTSHGMHCIFPSWTQRSLIQSVCWL